MDQELLTELIELHNQLAYASGVQFAKTSKLFAKSVRPSLEVMPSSVKGELLMSSRKSLIDFSAQTVNCILGQHDPWVRYNLAATILSDQPDFLSSKLASAYSLEFARRLSRSLHLPGKVYNFRQNNGSDAIELAIHSAKNASAKTKLIAFGGSYHGQNMASFAASETQAKHRYWSTGRDSVVFLGNPPGQHNTNRESAERRLLDMLSKQIGDAFAVIIEPIQVTNDANTPSSEFLRELHGVCTGAGVPLIFDEVQTGFGWLGKLSAAEYFGVNPEMLAFSKALTAGYGPLALLAVNNKYDNLQYGSSEKTTGGDIRSLVAALAVLDRLLGVEDPNRLPKNLSSELRAELVTGLLPHHAVLSRSLLANLNKLQTKFSDHIKWVNGTGLIFALVLNGSPKRPAKKLAKVVRQQALENGLLVRNGLSSVIIKPPLTISEELLAKGFVLLEKSLQEALR